MSIKIIHSESSKLLSERIFQEIKSITETNPEDRIVLIVPEKSKIDVERGYLEYSGLSGIMNTEIFSFSRFCYRVLDEIGKTTDKYIDEPGKSMLVYRGIKSLENEIIAFRNLCSGPGFVKGLISVMGEMNRALVSAENLQAIYEGVTDPISSRKVKELALIMERYEEELQRTGLKDPQDRYTKAAKVLVEGGKCLREKNSCWPYNKIFSLLKAKIFVLGFGDTRDFTPQEYSVLEALGDNTNVYISAVSDKYNNKADYENETFIGGRKLIESLLKKFPGSENEYITPDMEENFYRLGKTFISSKKIENKQKYKDNLTISVITGKDSFSELSIIAGEINRLVFSENMRYSDISVMTTDFDSYGKWAKQIFEEAKIPIYIDEKKKLVDTSLGKSISALLKIIRSGWKDTHVMSYLRGGFANATMEEIDDYENFMLSAGIRYKNRIFDDSKYIGKDGEIAQNFIFIRDRIFTNILILDKALSKCNTIDEFCAELINFLIAERIEEKITLISENLSLEGLADEATATVKAWNILMELLQQSMLIASGTKIDFKGFSGAILSGMEQAVSGTIPHYVDCVQISPIRYLTGRFPKVLFVVGLSSEKFPGSISDEGLLNDRDRQFLSGCLDVRFSSYAEDKSNEDMYTSFFLLTAPTQNLYLSSPVEEEQCANIIKFVRKTVDECNEIKANDNPVPDSVQVFSKESALQYIAYRRLNPSVSKNKEKWEILENIFNKDEKMSLRIDDLNSVKMRARSDIRILRENILSRYKNKPLLSISQLEKYSLCPFNHYSGYLLKLKERDIRKIRPLEFGSLLHGMLELAVKDFSDEYKKCDSSTEREKLLEDYENLDYFVLSEGYLEKTIKNNGLEIFLDKGNFASRGRAAINLSSSMLNSIFSGISEGGFIPKITEWKFSPENGNALKINTKTGNEISFTGIIDRVDFEDNNFRIIDYKSGLKKINPDHWYHGISLQLPAYIAAFMGNNPEFMPADVAYMYLNKEIFNMKGTKISLVEEKIAEKLKKNDKLSKSSMPPEHLILSSEHTLSLIEKFSDKLLGGIYGVLPRKIVGEKPLCEYCEYISICGKDKDCGDTIILDKIPTLKDADGKNINRKITLIDYIKKAKDND